MTKKITFLFLIIFLCNSCADTFSSVKRGLTGEKSKSTDEFLVQKKDPLILPPNYEDLPLPSGEQAEEEEVFSFEKTLNKTSTTESESSTASTTEESILQQIRKR